MQIKLPVVYPLADAYTNFSVEFSIFQTDEKYYPWILNESIQIYTLKDLYKQNVRSGSLAFMYNKYGDWQLFEYSANPYLEFEKIAFDTLDILLKETSLTAFLEQALLKDKYIFLPIDMYELPYYGQYHERHSIHHLFISGFDNENCTFIIHDNFLNGKYKQLIGDYNDIEKSYHSLQNHAEAKKYDSMGGICLFKFKQKPWHNGIKSLYSINLKTIKCGIHEYLMHKEYIHSYSHIDCYVYGVDCYDELTKMLTAAEDNASLADYRAFSAMLDHKRVMLFRMRYLQNYYKIDLSEQISTYTEIIHHFEILIRKIIKGRISGRKNIFQECNQLLLTCKNKEVAVLEKFLELI